MVILNRIEDEKDEIIKDKLLNSGMQRAIKIAKIEGPLTERGLDNDMKELMIAAMKESPKTFQGYDLHLRAVKKEDMKSVLLYIGTFKPMV